jgi:predicted peptidase
MMKKSKCILILAIILFSLQSCSKSDSNIVNDELPRTEEDVRNDFKNLSFQTGINDVSLESIIKGLFWNFRIIVPEGASDTNKKPLIFNLHGGAQNIAPEAHKSTDCLVSPGLDGIIDAFIISPNSNAKLWYDPSNQLQILALYDLVTSNLPIDISKVAITGYSDGGNGSWFYSQYFSNMFSAAIPMATSYNTAKSNGSVEPIAIPLYVIHGADDTLFPVQTTQVYVDASINAGSNIQFVIAPNLGHYQPCDYVSYLRDAAQWLVNTVWN